MRQGPYPITSEQFEKLQRRLQNRPNVIIGDENPSSCWMFQGNPDDFDVTAYIKAELRIIWSVTVKKYETMMKPGDPIFLWRAKGNSNEEPGIIAYGTICKGVGHKSEFSQYQYCPTVERDIL